MALKQTLTILDGLVHLKVNGEKVVQLFDEYGEVEASFQTVQGERRATDSVKIVTVGVAKEFVGGTAKFYDENECKHLRKLYGSMTHRQTLGVAANE
ncbi:MULTISPECIES: DUF1177 family protein [Lysinibacillus]|uniref:DUF1177 family protein n=1 Tax=Lysinibacillus TaxID=400634 RepID=UPI00083CA249|nr:MULTISPECIES: DUF1177 family protein [Lysinibacillus]